MTFTRGAYASHIRVRIADKRCGRPRLTIRQDAEPPGELQIRQERRQRQKQTFTRRWAGGFASVRATSTTRRHWRGRWRFRQRVAMIRGVDSILDAIGDTPLVRLRRCAPTNGAELWLKLESRNPTGSMKDRMALAMIAGAERDGLLAPGDTVVEYTGGSTGPALALVCRAKGYRALIVMADCFTEERFQLMRALGADIDVVPSVEGRPKVTSRDIDNMVARARELASAPGH